MPPLEIMPDQFQQAALLARSKQKAVHRSNFPKEVREKRIKEKLRHYKSKLSEAATNRDTDAIREYLKKLYAVRAQLYMIRIEDEFGEVTLDQGKKEKELEKYYHDCYFLRTSFDLFLK